MRGYSGDKRFVKKLLDLLFFIAYTRNASLKMENYSEEVCPDEDDVSAQETLSCQSSWIPFQNEHRRRKKGAGSQKSKREKTAFRIDRSSVVYSFTWESRGKNGICLSEEKG